MDKTLNQRFQKLFQDGKLVDIQIGKWGMQHTVDEKNDLKLDLSKVPAFILPGKKKLIPDEIKNKFLQLEQKARNYLKTNSHKFPIAEAHFVPHKKMVEVVTSLLKMKDEYDKLSNEFFENYEKYKLQMFADFPDHRSSLEPFYPRLESLRPRFYFSINIYEVAVPTELKSLTLADINTQNIAAEKMAEKYNEEMKQQRLQAQQRMQEFVVEAAKSLRGQVVELFTHIADKIKNKEVVSHANVKSLKTIISEFDALDFFDDTEVKKKLVEVKTLLKNGDSFKDNETAIQKLRTVVDDVLKVASNTSDIDQLTGQYFRRLDMKEDL